MAKTNLAKAVNDFARAPNDLRSHLAIEAALKDTYKREVLEGGKFREKLCPAGMRYTIEFANGQSVSVVISDSTDKVIERTYTDRGDIHTDEVVKCLRGWVKSIEQAQHGGRPLDYKEYFTQWEKNGFDNQVRRRLRDAYIRQCPATDDNAGERFDRTMRRYRQAYQGGQKR